MKVTERAEEHGQSQLNGNSLQKDSAEHESYAGVCVSPRITENTATDANNNQSFV